MDKKEKMMKRKNIIFQIMFFFMAAAILLFLYKNHDEYKYTNYEISKKYILFVSQENEKEVIKETDNDNILQETDDLEEIVKQETSQQTTEELVQAAEVESELQQEKIETIKDVTIPYLIGMDETEAINVCKQKGYDYEIEYYLGGSGMVISQIPASSESLESCESITINISISQEEFSNKLLTLINEKRSGQGLGALSFSDELNGACSILAQENVNSVACIRPDGSHWSTVLYENSIWLEDGVFTTRSNITTLNNANGRIKYASNSYGAGNLLTPSYNVIGMAYASNNTLVIIAGQK